jgi:hypothetical protein
VVDQPAVQAPSRTEPAERAVTAICLLAAVAAFAILARHAAGYFFLFDDFALNGQASRWPLHDILATPLFGFYRPGEFLWVRAAHAAFGWHTPAGYAALTLLLHAWNALLVGRLARRLTGGALAAWVAGTLFALSPWSAEALFWMSAGFDVLSTCGALVALLAGLAACDPARSSRAAAGLIAVCAAATVVALFTKESTAILAGLFAATAGAATVERRVSWPRVAGVVAAMALLTGVYLVVRRAVLSSLSGGVYGDWFTLMAQADLAGNAGRLLRAAVVWPAPHDASFHTIGVMAVTGPLAAAALVLLAVAAVVLRPRVGAVLVAAAGLTLLPILWLRLHPDTSATGRVLYLPGVLLALLAAQGLQPLFARRVEWLRWSATAALATVCATAVVSLDGQRAIWAQAVHLSRATIEAFRPFVADPGPLHVENLPLWFEEGPYVVKSYAFGYYYHPARVPVVSATALTLTSVGGRATVTTRGAEPGASPAPPDARPIRLAIGLP